MRSELRLAISLIRVKRWHEARYHLFLAEWEAAKKPWLHKRKLNTFRYLHSLLNFVSNT